MYVYDTYYLYCHNAPSNFIDPSGFVDVPCSCGPDVTDWMVNAINQNKGVGVVTGGHRNPGWYSPLNPITVNYYLTSFRDLFKGGGPWDYKTSESFSSPHCPAPSCTGSVTLCGTCFYKDVTGNLNYGYIGDWMNIPKSLLLSQAAAAQPGGVDDPWDIAAIQMGFDLADANTANKSSPLTANQLCSAVNRNASRLNLFNIPRNHKGPACVPCSEKYVSTRRPVGR
jgi:hypothetical protein